MWLVVDAIVAPTEALDTALPASRSDVSLQDDVARSPHLLGLVTWITGGDADHTDYLLNDRPALLSGIWIVLLVLAPALVAACAFDQTASDIGSRWHRFVVFRARRTSVFAGRLLLNTLVVLALYALICGAVVLYVDLRIGLYPRGALYAWGGGGYLALATMALPYLALCSLASAASRSATQALGLCVVVIVAPIVILGLLSGTSDSAAGLERLHPWGWKLDLMHPEPETRLLASAMHIAFAAGFAAVGALVFARRDL